MPESERTRKQVAEQGEAIYEREIRPTLDRDSRGKYLVLDIESRSFEIADDDLTATQRLLARRPRGVFYGLRIGYPAAYRLGGFSRVADDD